MLVLCFAQIPSRDKNKTKNKNKNVGKKKERERKLHFIFVSIFSLESHEQVFNQHYFASIKNLR
jgi:hypothetical protein